MPFTKCHRASLMPEGVSMYLKGASRDKRKQFDIDDAPRSDHHNDATEFKAEPLPGLRDNKETRVTIIGNRILVPVKRGHRYREVKVQLLLDTGASMTTLNSDIAKRLKRRPAEKAYFRLAAGRVLQAGGGNISYIRVGSIKKSVVPRFQYSMFHHFHEDWNAWPS